MGRREAPVGHSAGRPRGPAAAQFLPPARPASLTVGWPPDGRAERGGGSEGCRQDPRVCGGQESERNVRKQVGKCEARGSLASSSLGGSGRAVRPGPVVGARCAGGRWWGQVQTPPHTSGRSALPQGAFWAGLCPQNTCPRAETERQPKTRDTALTSAWSLTHVHAGGERGTEGAEGERQGSRTQAASWV